MNLQTVEQERAAQNLSNYMRSEMLRKAGIYVWAFPITYPDKITFGWEYELPDGRTSWYNEECATYEDAMTTGLIAAEQIHSTPPINR